MRILIADDDPQILRALRITLTAKGYQIFTAADGAEAIAAAIDRHPDISVSYTHLTLPTNREV